jgi:ribonuclease HII
MGMQVDEFRCHRCGKYTTLSRWLLIDNTSAKYVFFAMITPYMARTVGIDEVGRGPIAGPVAVASFCMLRPSVLQKYITQGSRLRDSKKLSKKAREEWYTQIRQWQKAGACDFSVVMISAKQIDKIGIAPALRTALAQSLENLALGPRVQVLLDGGLRAPAEYKNQKTIVKGDEKEWVIALASIVAKVTRDTYMTRMAKKYPQYGFDTHVGYGTKRHYDAIESHGLCELHRRSFLRK